MNKSRKKPTKRREDNNLVPNKIREWRLHHGEYKSQMSLARAANLSPNTIHRLESFRLAWTPNTLLPIAKCLNCHPGDLISRDPKDVPIFQLIWDRCPDQKRAKLKKSLDKVASNFRDTEFA